MVAGGGGGAAKAAARMCARVPRGHTGRGCEGLLLLALALKACAHHTQRGGIRLLNGCRPHSALAARKAAAPPPHPTRIPHNAHPPTPPGRHPSHRHASTPAAALQWRLILAAPPSPHPPRSHSFILAPPCPPPSPFCPPSSSSSLTLSRTPPASAPRLAPRCPPPGAPARARWCTAAAAPLPLARTAGGVKGGQAGARRQRWRDNGKGARGGGGLGMGHACVPVEEGGQQGGWAE